MPMIAFLACAPPPPIDTGSTDPSVELVWPEPESTVVNCATFVGEFDNFTLREPAAEGGQTPGVGHWHVEYAGTYELCSRTYCPVLFNPEYTSAGTLSTKAVLVYDDHSPVYDADENPVSYTLNLVLQMDESGCAEGGVDTASMYG